jgi:hypothetical protein
MDNIEIKKILGQLANHEQRITNIENIKPQKTPKVSIVKRPQKRPGKGEDLHPPIEKLLKNSFFKGVRIDTDVVTELQKKLLTNKKPLRASVVNVLRSMVRSGILERTEVVKGKKTLIGYIKS